MATVTKALARAAFETTEGFLYSTPTNTIAVVTNILIVNTAASTATFTILFDDVEVFPGTEIPGKGTISMDLKQVLDGSSVASSITGFASATSVKVHISGVELS